MWGKEKPANFVRFEVTPGSCPNEQPATPAKPAAKCDANAYMGTWQRPGTGPTQKRQVQLVFETDDYGKKATTRGFNRAPYSDSQVIGTNMRTTDKGCTFVMKCGTSLSSAPDCKFAIDPAKNTLTFVDGGGYLIDSVWTRVGGPPPAEAVCKREDVEGNWHRSDGAYTPIVGVHAFAGGDGGNALIFNVPADRWPKGHSKFRRIFRDGGETSCKLNAICASYDRMTSGALNRRERACVLTIDPKAGTMTESGNSLIYRRAAQGGAAKPAPAPVAKPAPPPEPKVNEQEVAATQSLNAQQNAAAKRETQAYEAEKKRIADKAAADQAAYRKALADREARIAEINRKAAEDRRRWEQAVAACKAGDHSQCGPKPQ